jgi:hypothetical protein
MTSIGSFSLYPDVRFWRFTNQTGNGKLKISLRCEFCAKPDGTYLAPQIFKKPIPIWFDTGADFCVMNTGLVESLCLSTAGDDQQIRLADGNHGWFKMARAFIRIEASDVVAQVNVAHNLTNPNRILLPSSILKFYQVLLTDSDSFWVER